MDYMEWGFLGLTLTTVWFWCGVQGSRYARQYHKHAYKHLTWGYEDEMATRLWVFFGPLNLIASFIVNGKKGTPIKKDDMPSWFD